MRKRRKKKKEERMSDLTSFDVWFRPETKMSDPFDFNNPCYNIMAFSSLMAAKNASKLAGFLYERMFKGIETSEKEANYVIRPTMYKSPRFLTFWK